MKNKEKDFDIKSIKTKKIKIPDEFSSTYPKAEKIKDKYAYYKACKMNKIEYRFSDYIVIDKNNNLRDGYITYLLARAFGEKKIDVRRMR